MPDIQGLKKQLRGIRSTQKLTKAMKTVATVKFSKLNAAYGQYEAYGESCMEIFERHGSGLLGAVQAKEPSAPAAMVVMAANKGLCGSFNSELLSFAASELERLGDIRLIACGKKAIAYFAEKQQPVWRERVFGDVPEYSESAALLDELIEARLAGEISQVYVLYPQYVNMLVQKPAMYELFPASAAEAQSGELLIPDGDAVNRQASRIVFRAVFHKLVLETAIGAQAATLMTMRSAYDTASDYCVRLEGQINRRRQSAVTADVIETGGEREE